MTAPSKLPYLFAEQQALGELSPESGFELDSRLSAEPERRERLAEIQESNSSILAQFPAEEMAAAIAFRLAQSESPPRPMTALRWAAAGIPLVLLAALFAWWLSAAPVGSPEPDAPVLVPDVIRHKGDPRLEVHRRIGNSSSQLIGGDTVDGGALLQLRYFAGDMGHGVIFSLDSRGELTLHYPDQLGKATKLQPDRVVALPFAYELDDAPGFERFFFLSSREPVDMAALLAEVRKQAPAATGKLDLPRGVLIKELLLRKPSDPEDPGLEKSP